ncbi:hypothetical protein [Cetobacterium somerae]|uniref:hypothetical protein n=1 Tax=Cetobacterium TaxID=180162 RepID=UPI00248D7557|nr:hypothetical protein [Cetobacterium somerae]
MIIDKNRLNRIGIDRVVLNNFKIINFENLERRQIKSKNECIEKLEKKTDFFSLNYSVAKLDIEELYTTASLEFNPNKIREGNNIYNSTVREFKEQLDIIVQILLDNGICLDLTTATIKEIELNTTFIKKFGDLHEVMLLIGRANYKKALGMYSFSDSNIPSSIKYDRTIYINQPNEFKKDIDRKVIKIYDKTFELRRVCGLNLDKELTRVEVLCGRDYYRRTVAKYGITNSIYDLKDKILEDIFIKSLENEILTKPTKYLEKIKNNLYYDFFNFKRNEKVKREERKKLQDSGKDIPDHLRETKGVLKYLDKESWIFDYSFLQELVLQAVDKRHKGDYLKQINKNYMHKNNKEIYGKFLKSIFLG